MIAPRVVLVKDCLGSPWAVDPVTRTVYVLDDGDATAIGERVAEGLAVILVSGRPALRLIPGGAA